MTLEEVVRLAQEAGLANGDYVTAHPLARGVLKFAELVAATERAKYRGEIQRLTELANTAEKWRGLAMTRDGDGRTVQQVQEEAVASWRAKQPPAPLVVDMSGIDKEMLQELMRRSRHAGVLHPVQDDAIAAAAAAVAAEREACAKLCERYAMALDYAGTPYVRSRDCELAAKAIRARSAK